MERLPLQLAPGEQIVRQCDYRQVSAKNYERVENYTLTNKRLISRSTEQEKADFTVDSYEIPINEIDTIKTYYRQEKKPVSIMAIVIALLMFVGAVVTFIVDLPIYVGLIIIAVAALIIVLAIVMRKSSFAFSLDVARLGGKNAVEHLNTGAATVKSNSEFESGSSDDSDGKRSGKQILIALLQVLFTLGFIGAVMAIILFTSMSRGRIDTTQLIIFAAAGLVCLVISIALSSAIKKSQRGNVTKNRRKQAAAVATKASMMKATITLATGEITAFLDEVGALIENYKTKTDESESN